MLSFKEFLKEQNLHRFTVYALDNKKANFLEYLNHDELDPFMSNSKQDKLLVVSSNGNWVAYNNTIMGPVQFDKGTQRDINRKFNLNKQPDVDSNAK